MAPQLADPIAAFFYAIGEVMASLIKWLKRPKQTPIDL
jgi:hypothetical protein